MQILEEEQKINCIEDQEYYELPYEEIMFRYDKKEKVAYMKFYGEEQEDPDPVPYSHDFFNQALMINLKLSTEQYKKGKEAKLLNDE